MNIPFQCTDSQTFSKAILYYVNCSVCFAVACTSDADCNNAAGTCASGACTCTVAGYSGENCGTCK